MIALSSYTGRRVIKLFNHDHDNRGRFASAVGGLVELPVTVEHAIAGDLKAAAQAFVSKFSSGKKLPGSGIAGTVGHGVKVVGGLGAKAYFAPWLAGQRAVAAVAKAKGLSDLETKRLTAICACYDAINCKAVFLGLEHSGLPHVAAASLFFPTASIAYLAHATATDFPAVARAAKAAVISAKRTISDSFKLFRDDDATKAVGILADALKKHAGDEFFSACLPVAMDQSNNASDAVALAEKALVNRPSGV